MYGSDVKIVDSFLMNVQQRHVIKSRLRHSSSQIGLKTPKTVKTSFSCGAGSGTTNSSCSRRSTSQKSYRTSAGFFRNKSAKDAMLATDSDLQEHRLGSMRSCNSRRPRSNSSYSSHNLFTPSPTSSPRQADSRTDSKSQYVFIPGWLKRSTMC